MGAEPIRDTRPQPAGRSTVVLGCSTQDVTNLGLHAASMPVRLALQACLNLVFQLAHDDRKDSANPVLDSGRMSR